MSLRSIGWGSFVVLVLALTATYLINPFDTRSNDPKARIFGFALYRIPSRAMEPTLKTGDLIYVNVRAYADSRPAINDVIVFKGPLNDDMDWVMRAVAGAGDQVDIANGSVVVNGAEIDQGYVDAGNNVRSRSMTTSIRVPDGHLFVLGDNRDNSNDSRYWGAVPLEDVIGKVGKIWYSSDRDRIGRNVE